MVAADAYSSQITPVQVVATDPGPLPNLELDPINGNNVVEQVFPSETGGLTLTGDVIHLTHPIVPQAATATLSEHIVPLDHSKPAIDKDFAATLNIGATASDPAQTTRQAFNAHLTTEQLNDFAKTAEAGTPTATLKLNLGSGQVITDSRQFQVAGNPSSDPPPEPHLTFDPVEGDDIVNAVELADGSVRMTGKQTNITGTLQLTVKFDNQIIYNANPSNSTAGEGWNRDIPSIVFPHDGSYFATITDPVSHLTASQAFTVDAHQEPPPPKHKVSIDPISGDDVLSPTEALGGLIIGGSSVGENGNTVHVDIRSHGASHHTVFESLSAIVDDKGRWFVELTPEDTATLPALVLEATAITEDGTGDLRDFRVEPQTPPEEPPPVAVHTYDLTKADLSDLLANDGVSQAVSDAITSHLTYRDFHDGDGATTPVEIVSAPNAPLNPVPDVKDDHGRDPQVMVLETSGNTVNETLDPSLRYVVDVADGNSTLNITGAKASVGVFSSGDGSDTIISSSTGAHETLQAGDANLTKLVGGSGAHDVLTVGNGNHDTILGGSGASDTILAGDGIGDSLQAGTGAHQLLTAGDGDADTLIGGTGAYDTLVSGHGQHDSLQAGSGLHQQLLAGDGDFDTLTAGIGGDTLSAGGDHDVFNIAAKGDDTVIMGGDHDTVNFQDTFAHAKITENDKTDVVTVKFASGQTIKLGPDDGHDITLHFSSGPDQHLT